MFTFYPANLAKYTTWLSYDNHFTEQECQDIIDLSKQYDANVPLFPDNNGNMVTNTSYVNSTIRNIPWGENSDWIFQKLYPIFYNSNKEYWNFELNGIFEALDIIEYDHGSMIWHADSLVSNTSTRKLTASIQLTDPSEYEGGDLELFVGEVVQAPKGLGTVILYPSYIYHQVTEVTGGIRTSMVVHTHGRPFR